MMDKRYQIFISSTFIDLQDERARVQNMIMQLGYIPAGMELFPAIDEEQLEFIKKIIDDSDYYLLIIGGRYGSVGKDGISYTEKEYDYAVSKGMKVIALIHEKPDSLSLEKSEKEPKARKNLERFKKKVKQGRMVLFWKDASELPGKLAQSLPVTIKTYPAVGWVRADSVPSPDVYKELNDLRKENDILKNALYNQGQFIDTHKIAGLDDSTSVELRTGFHANASKYKIPTTWGEIFYIIAPALMTHASETDVRIILLELFKDRVNDLNSRPFLEMSYESMTEIRIQLRALDLISLSPGQEDRYGSGNMTNVLVWTLSTNGEKLLVIERARRREG